MSDALLSFSLTPVQKFIEAARTVRDLKAGSKILSHLTWHAMKAGMDQDGQLLFPDICGASGEPDSIPNQFVMKFDGLTRAQTAAGNMPGAVRDRWGEIAGNVKRKLDKCWPPGWDDDWQEQINRYWDVRVIALEHPQAAEVLEQFTGSRPATVDIAAHFRALQMLLGAHKEIRHFPGDHGIGRHKCSMLGDLEQMGPSGLAQADQFWVAARGTTAGGAILAAKDRLCAVSLVKRFCAVDPAMHDLAEGVPDTAKIATNEWWSRAEGVAGNKCEDFTTARNALRDKLGNEGDTERRHLLMDELDAGQIAEDAGAKREDIAQEVEALAQARKGLLDATGKAGMEAPPRYFAILALDGDHMGQWLSGEKCHVDEQFYADMSGALREYAGGAREVVEEHHGYLVYAGGDDVLALLPLATATKCASELRQKFPSFAGDEHSKPSTASAGISVLHYLQDLRSGLRAARQAEKRAKQRGRDRLGINLLKRSGGDIELTLPWSMLDSLEGLRSEFVGGTTDRWLYKLRDMLPALDKFNHLEAVEPLISQVLRRVEMPSDAARTDFRNNLILPLWREVESELDDQHKLLRARGHDLKRFPGSDDNLFPQLALQCLVDFGLTASFLARGRD